MCEFEGAFPSKDIAKIWCDFNARGLSQEADDNCFYSFDRDSFKALPPANGMQIFIWDYSDEDEIIGYVAVLEQYVNCRSGWRARPIESTWFRGSKRLLNFQH